MAYHWFRGESVRALYDQLGAANPDTAVLKVEKIDDALYLTVIPDGASANAAINDSHQCPANCP